MADKKISQLTALSAANVASATDVLAIVDTSATETKKITAKDLIDGALNGGTANGVLYLNGSKVATSGSALVFDGTNLNLNSGTAVSATSGGSVTAGVFAARAPLSAHQTAAGVLQYSANETTLRSYGATGVTGALVFNLGAGGSADAEYMRLTSSVLSTVAGVNVGIGTATPGSYLSGTAKLVALANANSQNSILVRNDNAGSSASCAIALNASGNTWGIECGSTAKNSNALTFQLDYGGANSTQMILTSSGNLGIGTASPVTNLHVYKTTAATSGVQISSANWGSTLTDGMFVGVDNNNSYVYTYENIPLLFATNNTERGRFTSDGNFLVGTTSLGTTFGATAGVVKQTGGVWTDRGQVTVAGGTTTTLVTLANASNNQTYMLSVRQSGSQSNYVLAFVTAYGANSAASRIVQDNATGGVTDMNITVSGLSLRLVLGSGFGSTTWDWVLTRVG